MILMRHIWEMCALKISEDQLSLASNFYTLGTDKVQLNFPAKSFLVTEAGEVTLQVDLEAWLNSVENALNQLKTRGQTLCRESSVFFISLEDVFVGRPRQGRLLMMQFITAQFSSRFPSPTPKLKKKNLTPGASNSQTEATVSICIHDLQVC